LSVDGETEGLKETAGGDAGRKRGGVPVEENSDATLLKLATQTLPVCGRHLPPVGEFHASAGVVEEHCPV